MEVYLARKGVDVWRNTPPPHPSSTARDMRGTNSGNGSGLKRVPPVGRLDCVENDAISRPTAVVRRD